MKKIIFSFPIISLVCVILFNLPGCTKNPFGSDQISFSDQIQGKVLLNDGASPDSIYVWFQGFNLATWTNNNGDFKISLPSPESQGGSGLTGSYHLYFYVANYQLDSAVVVVRNGRLEYSHGDLDNNGKLKRIVTLIQILDIQTVIDPPDFPQETFLDWWEYEQITHVEVTLTAGTNRPVLVNFHSYNTGPASVVFIKKIYPQQDLLIIKELTPITSYDRMVSTTITAESQTWSVPFTMKVGDLPEGKYKIIPYFLINQKAVPSQLIESLGPDYFKPVAKYLSLPLRRQEGDFTVKKWGDGGKGE